MSMSSQSRILRITGDKVFTSTGTILPAANDDVSLYETYNGGRGKHQGTNWKHITISIFSDQSSASNGLRLYDANGYNADGTPIYDLSVDTAGSAVQFSVVGGTYFKKELSVSAPDWKIRYIHGATLAGAFRWSIIGDPMIP